MRRRLGPFRFVRWTHRRTASRLAIGVGEERRPSRESVRFAVIAGGIKPLMLRSTSTWLYVGRLTKRFRMSLQFSLDRDLTPTLIIQSLFRSVTLTFRRSLISRHVAALPKYLLVTAGTEIHPVSGSYGRMLRLVRTLRYQLSGCKERR